MIEDYRRLLALTKPEMIPLAELEAVLAGPRLTRRESDMPVLLSAMEAQPDWLQTHNTKHFTQAVAQRSGLRIAAPVEFFRILSDLLQ